MWTEILLLLAITVIYAGYNRLVKVSSNYVPEPATSTVLATICLQRAALAASGTGRVAAARPQRSCAEAVRDGIRMGGRRGLVHRARGDWAFLPVSWCRRDRTGHRERRGAGDRGHRYRDGLPRRIPVLNAAENARTGADAVTP